MKFKLQPNMDFVWEALKGSCRIHLRAWKLIARDLLQPLRFWMNSFSLSFCLKRYFSLSYEKKISWQTDSESYVLHLKLIVTNNSNWFFRNDGIYNVSLRITWFMMNSLLLEILDKAFRKIFVMFYLFVSLKISFECYHSF